MERSLIVPEDVRAALSVAGWDMDSEMENMSTEHSGFEIPVIRVEHRTNSKHVFYVDHGASYNTEQPSELELGDTVTGVIFAHQHIRAKWVEGKEVPIQRELGRKSRRRRRRRSVEVGIGVWRVVAVVMMIVMMMIVAAAA